MTSVGVLGWRGQQKSEKVEAEETTINLCCALCDTMLLLKTSGNRLVRLSQS